MVISACTGSPIGIGPPAGWLLESGGANASATAFASVAKSWGGLAAA